VGLLLGLLFGLGLLLVATSGRPAPTRTRPGWRDRRTDLLRQAGISGVTGSQLTAVQAVAGVLVGVLALGATRAVPVAVAFGLFAGAAPGALVKRRRAHRALELREVWPELVDNLASAVRAGLSLPEALAALGERGPEELRTPFRQFGEDYRATGRFSDCLDRLKVELADPVGDRLCESLRLARQVGGSDLGRLLRTLSAFLREDARTRAELETRQGWSVNAARLAVAAPWLVLLLLATQPATISAYDGRRGAVVLAVGGAVCVVAYRLMMRIGQLPQDRRVLR